MKQVELSDLSDLECRCFLEPVSVSPLPVLVIRFGGSYRVGSEGDDDARYMFASLRAAYEAWEFSAYVIDLTELRYEWGDYIEALFSIRPDGWGDEEMPRAMVVGPHCERALASLYYDCDLERTRFEEPWVFRELDAAMEFVASQLR